MTVRELYDLLNEKIPPSLSCEWDNDGLMCCPLGDRQVKRVLVALDVTEQVVREAIAGEYDLIVSHHPLLFKGLKAVDEGHYLGAKTVDLIREGVAVMSFHTRLDAVEGGVNDVLAQRLGLCRIRTLVCDGEAMVRMGELEREMPLDAFARQVKLALDAPVVCFADAGRRVRTVAVLGGKIGEELEAARLAGADTFVTGEAGYNKMIDAPEQGINLITAGHYDTENPVCEMLADLVCGLDPTVICDVMESAKIRTI